MAIASDITIRVQSSLGDINKVRYPDSELLKFIGDGQRAIIQLFPEAYTIYGAHTTTAGNARQTAAGWKIINVHSNKAGSIEGNNIPLVEMNLLDCIQPGWRQYGPVTGNRPSAASGRYYTAWAHDPREPAVFYLYPLPVTGYDVFITYSSMPADPGTIGATLALADQFVTPLFEYTLYRAFMKEGRYAVDPQIAQTYWERFKESLSGLVTTRKTDNPQAVKPPGGP